ncbi:class IV adenylate cyclase [Candidatus Pacearchaeota archaeon]|nr:class IV adenylate cyclase [Candidatus Pacearchaeota archaeon]
MHINVEFKARCRDPEWAHSYLQRIASEYKGLDHQIDIYFNVPNGRLKLRKGNIENSLIYYQRENISGPKQSDVTLLAVNPDSSLEEILRKSLGVKVEVHKKRHIYFADNVKFHIDEVKDLGNFIEVEALDLRGNLKRELLEIQCKTYREKLRVEDEDLISCSYSDMLLKLEESGKLEYETTN